MLNKTLLGSAAVIMTMVGAQAADLPSKKAAPATYVKICDAYGAGFFYIPGSETCVKLGGYLRYEIQYTPGRDIFTGGAAAAAQRGSAQDTLGHEYRGRIEVDARTPTSMGVARTFISLRGAGQTGTRGATYIAAAATAGNGVVPNLVGGNGVLTMERAFIQWAGVTAGVATSNYALMPALMYSSSPWAGFPNGQRQISYTAVLGGGFSATLALEDKQMWGYDKTYLYTPSTGIAYVGNVRLDQSWGWAAVHGVVTNNSYATDAVSQTADTFSNNINTTYAVANLGGRQKSGWAIGATTQIKLPMLAAGDTLHLTANYTDGYLGAIMGAGVMQNQSNGSGGRINGGVIRLDSNVVWDGTRSSNSTGWNVGGILTHYWDPKWRSNISAGYAQINPPNQTTANNVAWGKGSATTVSGSLIYSPVANMDIGLEVHYMSFSNAIQNAAAANAAWTAAGRPGLSGNNVSTKFRIERGF